MEFYSLNAIKPAFKGLAICFLATSTMTAKMATASTGSFIDDSTLKGGVFYIQRDRERKDMKTGDYKNNLKHSTFNINLDYSSGYFADKIGFDLAAYGAIELNQGGPTYPNGVGLSSSKHRWEEKWDGDASGVSLYKAAAKMKLGPLWVRGGYIQPIGVGVLSAYRNFMPGTYRGVEAGTLFDFAEAGALSIDYMWTDQYKAPWYKETYNYRRADEKTGISYVYSVGMKYDFKNDLVLEAAYGEAKNYLQQYLAKAAYKTSVINNPLKMSYEFYGSQDNVVGNGVNDIYDGLAWLQALKFNYINGPFEWNVEGTWVKAEGRQGYFYKRMTPSYAPVNWRLDVWWDARSDFNANGEKAVYAGVNYDLSGWDLPGWKIGTAYVYAWDAKPNNLAEDQNYRLKESAWNVTLSHEIQEGRAKGTRFRLHYTQYDNHSDLPNWSGGYGNIFQDEKDIKFTVVAPFTIFS